MALTYGQKWAFYTLMATHPTTANNDGKSQLRVDVEKDANGAADLQPSLVKLVNARFGLAIPAANIGTLPQNFTAVQLRKSLGFTDNEYDPTMGPCPDGTTDVGTGKKFDHQLAIALAILPLTGPVPVA
jgi:hypothetical protein